MKSILSLIATITIAMPALAQDQVNQSELRIENVGHVTSWRGNTLMLHYEPRGLTLRLVQAPLAEFRFEYPDTLILPLTGAELIAPTVFTAIYISTGGIRIIVQTPCSRYSSVESCAKAFAEATKQMEKYFPKDELASRSDMTIVIPKATK